MANASEAARPLPLTLEEITPAWLTKALRIKAPGVTVRGVELVDMIRGTCTKIRLRLDLDEAAKAAGVPGQVYLKGGFEEHSRKLTFVLMTEALGYRDLLDEAGLNSPQCYFADWDAERAQGIVIMEDLTLRPGVTFGDPLEPRSHDDVAKSLELLANHHARTWGCGVFPPGHKLEWVETAPPFSRPGLQPYLAPEAWRQYCEMPRGAAASEKFKDRDWAIGALRRMEVLSAEVPNCVIHGDTHLGNTFWQENGGPGFYDIVPRRAPPMAEVCYHITLSLDVADRPKWERALVRHYLDELRFRGVEDIPSFDEAMRQHGAFLIEGFCLVLTNDAYFQPEPPITAYASRFSQAMLDNDTARLLAPTG